MRQTWLGYGSQIRKELQDCQLATISMKAQVSGKKQFWVGASLASAVQVQPMIPLLCFPSRFHEKCWAASLPSWGLLTILHHLQLNPYNWDSLQNLLQEDLLLFSCPSLEQLVHLLKSDVEQGKHDYPHLLCFLIPLLKTPGRIPTTCKTKTSKLVESSSLPVKVLNQKDDQLETPKVTDGSWYRINYKYSELMKASQGARLGI